MLDYKAYIITYLLCLKNMNVALVVNVVMIQWKNCLNHNLLLDFSGTMEQQWKQHGRCSVDDCRMRNDYDRFLHDYSSAGDSYF